MILTVSDLIGYLQDDETPLYLTLMSGSDKVDSDDIRQQVKICPINFLSCEAFADYVIDKILPVKEKGTDYGGALVVYIKTELKPIKRKGGEN